MTGTALSLRLQQGPRPPRPPRATRQCLGTGGRPRVTVQPSGRVASISLYTALLNHLPLRSSMPAFEQTHAFTSSRHCDLVKDPTHSACGCRHCIGGC